MAIKQGWPIALALGASTALAAASASATEAPIQSVTLYPGSATIERAIEVAPGTTQVEITGLLANFNTDTMRLQADPGIQVGQVLTRDRSSADSPSPREADLEAKVQALQDQIAAIEADAKAAQTAQAYLERLGSGGEGSVHPAPADPKNLLGTLDAIRKGSADALERIRADDIKKRALAKQLDALKRELGTVQASTRDSRTITVQLAARQAGRLLLSYQVNRAGWKPAYRASLDSNASSVALERLATISQKTGEDWSKVKLKLSTGQPTLSVSAPNPYPWLLTYQPPVDRSAMQLAELAPPAPPAAPLAFSRRAVTANATNGNPADANAADSYVAPILENQGNFSTEYEVPARVDLASDGREISVGLARQALPVKQRVQISPRTSKELAVLIAETVRPDGVWLPGQVQLRRDGSYVGAQHWDPQASERFRFAFGRDPLVRVTVEHKNEKSGQAGLFNRDNQKRIDDSYAVTSYHRQPIDILVLEPTPVSQSDKVSVKVALDPEPNLKEWEHRRGLVGWERTLKPNETARFNVGYVIDFPKEGVVFGLP
jgi:uncharacterized protein (TIGR02231 family)